MDSAKVLVIILIVCAVVCVSIGIFALMKTAGMYDHTNENEELIRLFSSKSIRSTCQPKQNRGEPHNEQEKEIQKASE